MLIEYIAIAVLLVLSTAVALIAVGLGTIFGPQKKSEAKSMPYESGMSPYGEGTRRMPVRFYLIAVLFILFDIETIFLVPLAVSFDQMKLFGLIEMVLFIVPVFVAYVYVWRRGGLDWD